MLNNINSGKKVSRSRVLQVKDDVTESKMMSEGYNTSFAQTEISCLGY